MESALVALKRRIGASSGQEIKLHKLPHERSYFSFLSDIGSLDGLLFAILIDMGDHNAPSITRHRDQQSKLISAGVANLEKDSGRRRLQRLAAKISELSPQLYAQLQCQIVLIEQVVRYGTLYYAQRHPQTLGRFRWRIDQKDATRTSYEIAFSELTPLLIQTRGSSHPLLTLESADYGEFKRFRNTGAPSYFEKVYGFTSSNMSGINTGLLCSEDRKFVDSKESKGVQVADLLASGLRRCLRRSFVDTQQAARLLGALMPERERERVIEKLPPPVLHLSSDGGAVSPATVHLLVDTMAPCARSLIVKSP